MSRIAYLWMILSLIPFFTTGQILTIKGPDGPLTNDTTVYIIAGSSSPDLFFNVSVTSNAGVPSYIIVKKRLKLLAPGTNHFFSFGQDYDSSMTVSNPVMILPGEEGPMLFTHYLPMGVSGVSIIQYVYSLTSSPNDSIGFSIKYTTNLSGIHDNNREGPLLTLWPNPCNTMLTISYNPGFTGSQTDIIEMRDLMGALVLPAISPAGNSESVIDVSRLSPGIYCCVLKREGKSVTVKRWAVH